MTSLVCRPSGPTCVRRYMLGGISEAPKKEMVSVIRRARNHTCTHSHTLFHTHTRTHTHTHARVRTHLGLPHEPVCVAVSKFGHHAIHGCSNLLWVRVAALHRLPRGSVGLSVRVSVYVYVCLCLCLCLCLCGCMLNMCVYTWSVTRGQAHTDAL